MEVILNKEVISHIHNAFSEKYDDFPIGTIATLSLQKELYMICCELYFGLLKSLYRVDSNLERYRLWYGEISLRPDFNRYKTTQGHICNAIYNVMDTFFKFPEYDDVMEPMRHIIEKGYDTDSNAALLGALLGAKQAIPTNHLKKIRGIEKVEKIFLGLHFCKNAGFLP